MSDNVKDGLAAALSRADYEVAAPVEYMIMAEAALVFLAGRGMVVLGPDGEPLDVRPAPAEELGLSVALSQIRRGEPVTENIARVLVVALARVTGRLAAAEVET